MTIKVNKKIRTKTVQFNPSFYKNAYNRYKNGYYGDLIAMMNEVVTDSHVYGCLTARISGFQKPYSLNPYSEENPRDIDNTNWLKDVLKNLKMRSLFEEIQDAMLKKFSVIDFEWDIIKGKQTPVSHEKIEHKYFRYKDDILYLDFAATLKPIPEDVLVCEVKHIPVLLPVLRDYILKNFGLESWASFIEVFGEPMILGYYPPDSGDAIKKELDDAVNSIAASSRGTAPKGTEINIEETQRRTGDHDRFTEVCDNGISITILGHENAVKQTMGLQVGENLSSYYAKRDIVINDSYYIEEQIQKFINRLWDRNFGDGRYPLFEIDKSEPVNVAERIDILDLYLRNGGIAKADEFRKLGIDVPDDIEYLSAVQKQQTPAF